MDGFDRRLEIGLAMMLDPIARASAPLRWRRWEHGRSGRLRAISGGLANAPAHPLVMADTVVIAAPAPADVATRIS